MVTAIVGGSFGDEGKGKMTDLLAGNSDIVVRFQGGANAGHTVINDCGKFILHMLPSGVFHRRTENIIARRFLDEEFRKRDFFASPKFELATSPQIVGFAARNMGIGCVVSDFAKQAEDFGKIKEIKVRNPLPTRRICIVRSSDMRSIAANKLLDMILNNIAPQIRV